MTVRCDCGAEVVRSYYDMRDGKTSSCGCFQRETISRIRTKHGRTRTPEWKTWVAMVHRCTNPNEPSWPDYGGRGITVCDRWQGAGGFQNFLEDMGERPLGTSIDRIDGSLGYFKANCRWATFDEQNQNRRSTRLNADIVRAARISAASGESYAAIASRLGVGRGTIQRAVLRKTWRNVI